VASDEVSRKDEMTRSFHHRGHRGHRDGEKRERGKRGARLAVRCGRIGVSESKNILPHDYVLCQMKLVSANV